MTESLPSWPSGSELFTLAERDNIIMAILNGSDVAVTTYEITRIFELLREVKIKATMLQLAIDGKVGISLFDLDLAFTTVKK